MSSVNTASFRSENPAPSHLRGQGASTSSALLETNSSESDIERGISADLSLLDALPTVSNSSENKALEDQVTDLFKLRSSMTKEQFEATPFGKSVKKIMDLIEHVMMPKVLEAHDANQKELDKLQKETSKCGTTKNEQVTKANVKKTMYLKFSPLHKTCRAGEAGAYTEKTTCWEEEADKKKIKDLKCQAFAMVKKQTADQTANKQIMKKGGSESDESYVERISSTICGKCVGKGCKLLGGAIRSPPGKKCGYDPYSCGCGFKCKFEKARDACEAATADWQSQVKKCKASDKLYSEKKEECDSLQDQMDDSACKRAVQMKDACQSYEECHFVKKKSFNSLQKMVKQEEIDRQAEWRGLKRMLCLIKAFGNKKVTDNEIDECKKKKHRTDHLIIKYPKLPKLVECSVPHLYPNTPSYKRINFAPLPALAKGKQDAYECTGLQEISTTPAAHSPKTCKCERVTLNGPYSPGPMVKCVNCLDVRRSLERNSCPDGTKLFSPRSDSDWKTFLASATPVRAPHFIVDITRPQNGCGGCNRHPMNSKNRAQMSWVTADASPWWLRSTKYGEPNGDYHANCYLDIKGTKDENSLTFNDHGCQHHSKSYYCQAAEQSLTPKKGSPRGCVCKNVALTGKYSAGALLKCTGCLRVSRSTQKNSCPVGTKIFSPRTRADWKTFIASATPLRSPHWIIDVTQPQNGCGGCTKNAMNSKNPAQATWMTSDGTPWYLRNSRYSEPNGDYHANCYMDLGTTANENSVTFNDHNCAYNSDSYYCQPAKSKKKKAPLPPPPEDDTPVVEQCKKPKGYCSHAGAVFKMQDCDGDGVDDPYCEDKKKGHSGFLSSANDCKTNWPSGKCQTCDYSEKACKDRATAMKLKLGGNGHKFAGVFGTKGCYYYKSGKYAGRAYYGYVKGTTEVNSASQLEDLKKGQLRIDTCSKAAKKDDKDKSGDDDDDEDEDSNDKDKDKDGDEE